MRLFAFSHGFGKFNRVGPTLGAVFKGVTSTGINGEAIVLGSEPANGVEILQPKPHWIDGGVMAGGPASAGSGDRCDAFAVCLANLIVGGGVGWRLRQM